MIYIEGIGTVSKDHELGDLVAKLRAQRGLSIAQLAARVGVNAVYLSQVERGTRLPSDEMIRNLADFFKIDEDILFEMVSRVPLVVREELENQTMLQKALQEMTKMKLSEHKKQEIYQEFLLIVQRSAFSA